LPSASAITPAVARCTSTHTHVDSRPAATTNEHPVRGRVKAGRPRGEAVCGRRLRGCCTAGKCMP
jgi:hypothetical protein